jgi:hypothetical protein
MIIDKYLYLYSDYESYSSSDYDSVCKVFYKLCLFFSPHIFKS